jgi:hypothetical protein
MQSISGIESKGNPREARLRKTCPEKYLKK